MSIQSFGENAINYPARKKLFPGDGFVSIGGTKVWYHIQGKGSQIPLVLLHGGPGAPSHYLNPLGELATDRPVVFFDQPGCGRSGKVRDMSAVDVNYFVAVVEQLTSHLGITELFLYGQSWGSLLALEYYLQHPEGVRAMVFSSPLISTQRWIQDTDLLISTLPVKIQEAIRKHEASLTFDSPEYQHAMQVFYEHFLARKLPWPEDMMRTFEQMGVDVYNHMWGPSEFTANGLLRNHDRSDRLRDILVPVLYLCGAFDEARPETISRFHHMTPGSTMHVIQDAAHMTMHDSPGEDVALIRDFLGKEFIS